MRHEDDADPLEADEAALRVLVDALGELAHERHHHGERQLLDRVADQRRVAAVQHALQDTRQQ